MKAPLFLGLLGLVAGSRALGAGEGYVNFIRQVQQDTGVVWNMPVAAEGESASPGILDGTGSLFQLWTVEQSTAKDHLLDQALVGAYLPSATITITSQDPHGKVPRTRADQPFTVTCQVSGLLSGAGLPSAATSVLLEHHVANYPAGKTAIPLTTALSGQPESTAAITANGTVTLSFPVTSLKATDPTKAAGEEHFVIHALSDGSISQTQLASAHVEVWPVTSGGIQGISPGELVRFHVPNISATYTDVYPGASIWLQVYPGPEKLGTEGAVISSSKWVNTDDASKSNLLPVANYGDLLTEDGTYTIEMLTLTPFGLERLDHVTFSVDRKLEIRAQLGGLDQ
jgi:hypothetical protein